MFFENFNTVVITLINSKNTILYLLFFCMIDSNFNVKKNYVHLIVQIWSKANDVIKIV